MVIIKFPFILIDIKDNIKNIRKYFNRLNVNKIWNECLKKIEYNEEKRNYMTECKNFKCSCGSVYGTQYSYQTRSADEPATIFKVCLMCKKTIKY